MFDPKRILETVGLIIIGTVLAVYSVWKVADDATNLRQHTSLDKRGHTTWATLNF